MDSYILYAIQKLAQYVVVVQTFLGKYIYGILHTVNDVIKPDGNQGRITDEAASMTL